MPSAKKKKQQARRKGGTSASSSSASSSAMTKVPRSNDDIVGKSWVNRPTPTKAMLRELEEALKYEVSSDKREKIIQEMAALAEEQKQKQAEGKHNTEKGKAQLLPDLDKLPVTYETPAMLKMLGGPTLLTYGKASPFEVRKVHPDPSLALKYALMSRDEENINLARRWTGEHSAIRLDFDVIRETTRSDLTVLMGECWLRDTDLWNFAGKFQSGASPYAWPDYFAVLQCPFCCAMSVPCHPKGEVKPKRKIMIMTNVSQFSVTNGSMHMPHRALPRLCCEECFVANLKKSTSPGDDDGAACKEEEEWKSYPKILEEGVAFTAARKMLTDALRHKIDHSTFLPDAYSLYSLYNETGMCAAITACIQDAQSDLLEAVSQSVGNINLNYKPVSGK